MLEKSEPLSSLGVVLIVDDDPVSLKLFTAYLLRANYEVVAVSSFDEAQAVLQRQGAAAFSVLLTDYRMPNVHGLDLIRWLLQVDDTLASVLITAEGGKSLVAESLRTGVFDFLEKPVLGQALVKTITRAQAHTRQRRHLKIQSQAVREMGEVKSARQRMRHHPGIPSPALASFPKAEVGGDFTQLFAVSERRGLLLCGDVSGHDLKAGYVSAYFLGLVQGLLSKEASISEIADFFNQHLLDEWIPPSEKLADQPTTFSVSACFVALELAPPQLHVLNCGLPRPLLVRANGKVSWCDHPAQPMGWFPELNAEVCSSAIEPGDTLYIYTDGLEDLAEKHHLNVLCLAELFLNLLDTQAKRDLLSSASDDITTLRWPLSVPALDNSTPYFQPLLAARYGHHHLAKIDALQRQWEQCLTQVDGPEIIPPDRLPDVLVCCREALINALKHGYPQGLEDACSFSLAWHEKTRKLRLCVADRGAGHQFNITQRIEAFDHLQEFNLGLTMLRALSDHFMLEDNGATVYLEFHF
jgi:phosphoserine phosphatase RsbU/P